MQFFLFHKVGMKHAKEGDHCIHYYYKNHILPEYYYKLSLQDIP